MKRAKKMRLKTLGIPGHTVEEQWAVEFHDEFAEEVRQLPLVVREKLKAAAIILAEDGSLLKRPFADTLKGSRYANMKELRFDAD